MIVLGHESAEDGLSKFHVGDRKHASDALKKLLYVPSGEDFMTGEWNEIDVLLSDIIKKLRELIKYFDSKPDLAKQKSARSHKKSKPYKLEAKEAARSKLFKPKRKKTPAKARHKHKKGKKKTRPDTEAHVRFLIHPGKVLG